MIDSLNRYWLRSGGVYSIAIVRIFLFLAVYYLLFTIILQIQAPTVAEWLENSPTSAYSPKGLVQIFPEKPPSAEFVNIVILVAHVSTVLSIVGLFTRPAMIISTLSVIFLVSLETSFRFYWSHKHNVICYVALAFMFGRAGDVWSIDAIIRKWRHGGQSTSTAKHDGYYWWPVLLGQAAAALFYFGAFYAKIAGPEYTFNLNWVLSDNLRHSLSIPWVYLDLEVPWYVRLAQSEPLFWKLVATGHLLTQFLPILACFSINRPWLRLSEGLIFAAGVFLLGSFMAYWNYHWLLLTAFFVDWDYFGSKLFNLQPKDPAIAVQGAETDSSKDEKRTRIGIHTGFIAAYICIFLGFYVSTFAFKLGRVHLLYPFSQLDFFAEIKALEPLNEHKYFPFFMGQTAIVADGKERFVKLPRSTTRSWVGYDSGIGARSALGEGDLKQRLSLVLSAAQLVPRETYVISGERREFTPQSRSQIRLYNTLFQFPAHPAPPTMEPVHRGLLGVFDMDSGRALVAHSRSYRDRSETERYLDVFAAGFEDPEVSLWYRLDPYGREGPQPLHPLASEIVSSKSISCAGNLGVDPEDTTGESVTITLRLAGEAYAGNPHFTLYFDGRTVGSGEVDWARDTREKGRYDTSGAEIVWREITFETTYMPSAIHSLWVAYDNDAWGGPEQPGWDRNLLIDYVTVNGKSLRAEEAFYDVKGEVNRSGQERLSLAGKLAFDLTCDDFPELADGQATRLTKFRFRLSLNVPDERVSSIIRIREHQDQGWYDYLGPELQ